MCTKQTSRTRDIPSPPSPGAEQPPPARSMQPISANHRKTRDRDREDVPFFWYGFTGAGAWCSGARRVPLLPVTLQVGQVARPNPPSGFSNSSRPRRAVRPGCVGGGGGHRTHVRKSSAAGIYINSRFSFALAARLSNRLDLRATSSLRSRPAPRSRDWSQSPEYDALTRTLMTRSGGRWRVLGRQG